MNETRQIELVKKSYEELQDMVIQLTTDKFILQSKIDKAIEYIDRTQMGEGYKKELHDILKEDK